MHSSTSNSKNAIALWGVKFLLATIMFVILAMELGARYGVPLLSWNMRRFRTECSDAMRVGNTEAPEILLLGNSLTYTDIDLDVLSKALESAGKVHRWATDDTNYLDWYYGLSRAFRAGARPKFVIIGARTNHLLARHVRGRFFAHYIMEWSDLSSAASRTEVDLTGFSSMAVARSSAFYGSREEIFKRCITLLLPRFPELGRAMMSAPAKRWDRSSLLIERLAEIRDLCARHGAEVIVWIPLTADADPLTDLAVEAGHKTKVPVLLPGRHSGWTDADFSDRFHMTATASKRFTGLFAKELESVLNGSRLAEGLDTSKEWSFAR